MVFKTKKETQKLTVNYPEPPQSIKFTYDPDYKMPITLKQTRIAIHNQDTIDCGIEMVSQGFNPLLLNLADDCMPGGCVNYGSGAQEEALFRRSNYWKTLIMEHYPITDNQAIYSPNVCVFRDNEKNNWDILVEPKNLDFIACPGIKFPKTKNDLLENEDIKKLERL